MSVHITPFKVGRARSGFAGSFGGTFEQGDDSPANIVAGQINRRRVIFLEE